MSETAEKVLSGIMLKEDAEEYTQALGQVVAGSWRQIALAKRLGVPQALGLSVEEWVNVRLGGYIKMSVEERQEAVNNLTAEGHSLREIGEILGVSHETARAAVKNLTPKPPKPPRALLASQTTGSLKLGYADPPYIECAHLYKDYPDGGAEVDHAALIAKLEAEFDGWVLHANATPRSFAVLGPLVEHIEGVRWCNWSKSFAASKPDVSVIYAWEPVIIKAARKPVVSGRQTTRDYINIVDEPPTELPPGIIEPITMRRNFKGAKPEKLCHWVFELLGAWPEDELVDLYPGSGAVTRAWGTWQNNFLRPLAAE
jgi:hypothetical protein